MSDGLPKGYDDWRTESEPSHQKMRYEFLCEDCDKPIYQGDPYCYFEGFNYCINCLENYRHSTDKDELCEYCEEDIHYDEMAYNIHGMWICESCMDGFKF